VAALVALHDTPAAAQGWQCVGYARQASAVTLTGDAWTWWDQAAGRYARGQKPRPGAVLVLQQSDVMRSGHVAVVRRVLSSREITLDHANWSVRGEVEENVLAVDVSPDNDWSQVRVWYSPGAALGSRTNPAYGFIYPSGPAQLIRAKPVVLAYAMSALDDRPAAEGRTLRDIIADVRREARLR
jgi:surface antigen